MAASQPIEAGPVEGSRLSGKTEIRDRVLGLAHRKPVGRSRCRFTIGIQNFVGAEGSGLAGWPSYRSGRPHRGSVQSRCSPARGPPHRPP